MSAVPPVDPAAAFRLDGQVAVVTGASRGIGLAIAEVFARAGVSGLVLNARKSDALNDAAAALARDSLQVRTVSGSMGDTATVDALVAAAEELGGATVLVNNAATNPQFGALLDADPNAVRKILAVNLEGPLALTRALWHAGMRERGGSVINLASIGGIDPMPLIGAYNVSKAALIHMTKQLARECAPQVRVNALAPGIVRTQFARALWEPDEAAVVAMTPLARVGEPIDVAHAALYLASPASAWVTGSVLTMDGGQLLA